MRKKLVISISIILVVALALGVGLSFGLKKDELPSFADIVGVWCWDENINYKYIDFACQNGVDEIYLDASLTSENKIISYANDKGMDVYWLYGNKECVVDFDILVRAIDKFVIYNDTYDCKFKGVHLDIEPHQFDDFDERREYYITRLVELIDYINREYRSLDITWDIPFWIDDAIEFSGVSKEAYKHIIDLADGVVFMTYRDSAEDIYKLAKDELDYAKSTGKIIFLSVETNDVDEAEKVTFFEEGASYMYEQLEKLKTLIDVPYGLCIHHLESWYDLAML